MNTIELCNKLSRYNYIVSTICDTRPYRMSDDGDPVRMPIFDSIIFKQETVSKIKEKRIKNFLDSIYPGDIIYIPSDKGVFMDVIAVIAKTDKDQWDMVEGKFRWIHKQVQPVESF